MSVVCPGDETPIFPTGFHVYYFNQWAGFETKELHQFFSHLDAEELFALKRGDIVWIDEEPYHRDGKVYGYTKRVVWGTELHPTGSLRVDFGPTGSMRFLPGGRGRSITKVQDEQALKNMLEKLGRFSYQLR